MKDIRKISNKKLKKDLEKIIVALKSATSLEHFPNLVKMKGNRIAYRIRIRDYRIGLYFEESTNSVELIRFLKRNDIYKVFPLFVSLQNIY